MPVCDTPVPQRGGAVQVKQESKPAAVASSPLTELASSQLPPTPRPNIDYQAVLLALADEYVNAAYSMSGLIATGNATDYQLEEYNGLMSTAMGCLESVLNNYRQSDPRKEARIRLRLASLLVEETENNQEAEEVLSKGLALCERSRLPDLKYAMHHLSVRVLFKSSPKAALKAVDKIIPEVESLRLVHWIYAFRFLRVSLGLQLGSHSDTTAILKHLTAVNTMAEEQRHIAVQIIAGVLEAIVHLRSGLTDAVDLTQRAMATARTHQLGPEMQQIPQARALLDCLDLTCNLVHFHPDRAKAKLEAMQEKMDNSTRDPGWNKDGRFAVELVPSANEDLEQDTCGIMRRSKHGQAMLVFRWLTRNQLYALGYLLSGLATLYQGSGDGKTEHYLSEGLKLTKLKPDEIPQSLTPFTARIEQHASFRIAMQLHMVLFLCGRYDWATAGSMIQDVRKELANDGSRTNSDNARTLLYLEAVCRQGLGELQAALELYDSPRLIFDGTGKTGSAEKDLRALASLNSIFILRTLSVGDIVKADNLLTAVKPYCLSHHNKAIAAACQLVMATGKGPNNTIIKTKQHLQLGVRASKASANNQLTAIVMNFMTSMFFTKIVGDQAQSCATTGRTVSKKARSKLWTVVADGMYGDIMERCGKAAEADAARREAQSMMADLPASLRDSL